MQHCFILRMMLGLTLPALVDGVVLCQARDFTAVMQGAVVHRPWGPFKLVGGWRGISSVAVASLGQSSHHVDVAAYALLDVCQTAVYLLVATFGPVLRSAMGKAALLPAYGTVDSAAELLAAFIAQEE